MLIIYCHLCYGPYTPGLDSIWIHSTSTFKLYCDRFGSKNFFYLDTLCILFFKLYAYWLYRLHTYTCIVPNDSIWTTYILCSYTMYTPWFYNLDKYTHNKVVKITQIMKYILYLVH